MSRSLATSLGLARSLVVYYGRPWQRSRLKRFYGQMIEPGDLVFDIGAHVGSRTRALLAAGARVVAVEPQPIFADFLQTHFLPRLEGLERVAVGRRAGEIDLRISSRHPTVTSISPDFVAKAKTAHGFEAVIWDQTIRVPMVTLDGLIARYGRPAFCKIDVEGAEAEIIGGLSHPIPWIAFEYLPAMPDLALQALDAVCELGDYRYNRVLGEQQHFVHGQWLTARALRDILLQLPTSARSGDIYARLSS
ncbi:methyltransferase FkbM [Rhizobium sp. Leaf384]|uniref:FkbM family methyltransferase n=1 Tax=unclassified Rhizobium TaxID=2613769 RepID=UPI000715CA58|nr:MULTISPECIES: FkbM family methyltransferase [unclassified Rhizobium]KQS74394.1 methyltransferase FkbM [Rhizobium sp. Leaf383]KQS80133.1 methyltransferase FkbM [Rhizobium sp. Leaf384]